MKLQRITINVALKDDKGNISVITGEAKDFLEIQGELERLARLVQKLNEE